jgi:hypothetical protein
MPWDDENCVVGEWNMYINFGIGRCDGYDGTWGLSDTTEYQIKLSVDEYETDGTFEYVGTSPAYCKFS